MKTFEANELRQNYKFLIGAIVPRPIAVVATINKDGSNNLAPFSFFTAVSANPMIIGFSPIIRTSDGLKKDTHVNIEANKEFVINFCTEELAERVNLCGTELPYGEDEFSISGLTPIDSNIVAPKRVKESPIHYECKLRDILSYGDSAGAGSFITGEVVKIHVKEELLDEGRILTDIYKPIGRGSGSDWIKTDSVIQLERKMKTQLQK